jgi:hypothetical protein
MISRITILVVKVVENSSVPMAIDPNPRLTTKRVKQSATTETSEE